ncbi:hypothetical protein KO465_05125 [Candidatus Micrarchaeota archaeon]|nr:hypothetical protein [Candidatus Micrarchaeota archaeon]
MDYTIAKIILNIEKFVEETDRTKKQEYAIEIANFATTRFKTLAQKKPEVANLILPLVVLGKYQVNNTIFDPDPAQLLKIAEALKNFLSD